jgi:hypothetical protein
MVLHLVEAMISMYQTTQMRTIVVMLIQTIHTKYPLIQMEIQSLQMVVITSKLKKLKYIL